MGGWGRRFSIRANFARSDQAKAEAGSRQYALRCIRKGLSAHGDSDAKSECMIAEFSSVPEELHCFGEKVGGKPDEPCFNSLIAT